jgi:hypothetical protein
MTDWRIGPWADMADDQLASTVVARFDALRRRHFAGDLAPNAALGVELRALRRDDGWCIGLLLTPWMLARLLLPERAPQVPLPGGWGAAERNSSPYVVIGPAVDIELFGERRRAHVNHDTELGHYLIQPLIQSITAYADADAVFADWNGVLARRLRVMREQRRECPWQRELSRREFLAPMNDRRT